MLLSNPNLPLQDLPIEKLRDMVMACDIFLFKQTFDGEDYADLYTKYPDIFDQFIKKTVTLKNKVKAHFKDQSDRLMWLVNLNSIKADELSNQIYVKEVWDEEDDKTSTMLYDALFPIIYLGVQHAQFDFSYESVYMAEPIKLQKIMRSYATKLGGDINQTTRDMILQQVKTSIDLGEPRANLVDRLTPLVNSEKRALKIARSESVRIFGKGRFEVAVELNLPNKTWYANPGACLICRELNGKTVKRDQDFYSKQLGVYISGEPAHPNCNCGVQYHK